MYTHVYRIHESRVGWLQKSTSHIHIHIFIYICIHVYIEILDVYFYTWTNIYACI